MNESTKRRRYSRIQLRNWLSAYLYISPYYLIFSIFGIFPIYYTFYLAFQRWNGLSDPQFAGLTNFQLLMDDSVFWTSAFNTILIGLMGSGPTVLFALVVAFILNSALLRMRSVFQTIYFLPNVTSIVAVAIIFSSIFTPSSGGLANSLLNLFGIEPIIWQVDWWGVKAAISVMVIWRWTGYHTIIFLAGLQSIPGDLYEAATVDGASKLQQFLKISIPMLRPFIIFSVIISTIGALQLFAEPLVFMDPNVRNEGISMVLYIYQQGFQRFNLGYASAAVVVLFFMIVCLSIINYFVSSRIKN